MRPPFPVFPQSRRFRGRQFAASLEISRAANRKMKDLCLSGHYTSSIEKLAWGSEHHCGSTIREARVAGKFSPGRLAKKSKSSELRGHGPGRKPDKLSALGVLTSVRWGLSDRLRRKLRRQPMANV